MRSSLPSKLAVSSTATVAQIIPEIKEFLAKKKKKTLLFSTHLVWLIFLRHSTAIARCISQLSAQLNKYSFLEIQTVHAQKFVSFLVGDRTENETSGEKGTTRSSGNVFELSPVKRSNYSTLVLVSLNCLLPRSAVRYSSTITCHTRSQVEELSSHRPTSLPVVWQEVPRLGSAA